MAELAFKFLVFAFFIMTHGLLELKCFPTLIWTCVTHSEAFLIQVINKVFDFHWMLGFIAPVSSAAQYKQVVIDFFGKKSKTTRFITRSSKIAISAMTSIIRTRSTKDLHALLYFALYRQDSDLVACFAFEDVKK